MAVGLPLKTTYANGDVYSASDVNDTNGTVNLFTSSTLSVAAGKNSIINGGFDIWQRGTSSTSLGATSFIADRWQQFRGGGITTGGTISRQSSGLTSAQYCARVQRDSGNTSTAAFYYVQNYEMQNSIPLAGKTVVLSFYARAGANYSAASSVLRATIEYQTSASESNYWYIGDGAGDVIAVTTNAALTTNWTRYTATVTLPSTVTQIFTAFKFTPVGTAGTNDYFEVTSVQLELGSTATTFSRAGGTIQGELAACQRYYYRMTTLLNFTTFGMGANTSTSQARINIPFPVQMRVNPSSVDFSTLGLAEPGGGVIANTTTTLDSAGPNSANILMNVASGLTQYRPVFVYTNNSTSAFLGFNAEL
jgi:hypothetical protein